MSEHRFRELDQEWGRIEDRAADLKRLRPMIRPNAMTIRWYRRACDGQIQFLESPMEQYLVRAWKIINTVFKMRLPK